MKLGEKKEEDVKIDPKEYQASKLDPQLQDFIKLIFNKKLMEEAVASDGYDVKKLPLGDLSLDTI
jgi:hypothetical protein